MELGQIERQVGLLAGGIVGERVDPALQLAEEEPARSPGANEHDREFELEAGKCRLDRVGRRRLGRAGDVRAGPGTRRSRPAPAATFEKGSHARAVAIPASP